MTFGKIALFFFALEALAFPAIVAQSAPKVTAYPERPIRVLIPFAPGGATDIVARMLAPMLPDRLGQQIVPDNLSGAAGTSLSNWQPWLTSCSVPVALSESLAQFDAYVQSESKRWEKIIRENNVRID